MKRPDIDAIEARAKAATPADDLVWESYIQNCYENMGDGLFIVHARTDIPELVTYIHQLEKLLQQSEEITRLRKVLIEGQYKLTADTLRLPFLQEPGCETSPQSEPPSSTEPEAKT